MGTDIIDIKGAQRMLVFASAIAGQVLRFQAVWQRQREFCLHTMTEYGNIKIREESEVGQGYERT